MNSRRCVLIALAVAGLLVGCSQPEPEPEAAPDPGPQPTPAEVRAEFRALRAAVDQQRPGAAVASLTAFMHEQSRYDIVPEVESEIERLLSVAEGRYQEAREIARQGDFERAEGVLEDLSTHLPGIADGASAKAHLAFDFHLHRAQWLMVRQRWEETEAVARPLLDRDLTRTQAEQVQTLLDGVSQVGAALNQAAATQTRAACRQLIILLEMIYMEEGAYPATLTLSEVESLDALGSRAILRSLSAIERYQSSGGSYSFVAVGAGGADRVRVVDGNFEG